jgi:hypothetical protein
MNTQVPDSWIERNEDDPDDRYYRGGGELEDIFTAECTKCGEASNPDECDKEGRCPNCVPHLPDSLDDWLKQPTKEIGAALETQRQEFHGITSVLAEFNRRFSVKLRTSRSKR